MATGTVRAVSTRENPIQSPFDVAAMPAMELMALLTALDRKKIEALAEASIAYLDMIDGDPDLEGGWHEDGITDKMSVFLRASFGPGCEMSDPGEPDLSF